MTLLWAGRIYDIEKLSCYFFLLVFNRNCKDISDRKDDTEVLPLCRSLLRLGILSVPLFISQDWAAQRCTISYRAPELFTVERECVIDERTDIWVRVFIFILEDHSSSLYKHTKGHVILTC